MSLKQDGNWPKKSEKLLLTWRWRLVLFQLKHLHTPGPTSGRGPIRNGPHQPGDSVPLLGGCRDRAAHLADLFFFCGDARGEDGGWFWGESNAEEVSQEQIYPIRYTLDWVTLDIPKPGLVKENIEDPNNPVPVQSDWGR